MVLNIPFLMGVTLPFSSKLLQLFAVFCLYGDSSNCFSGVAISQKVTMLSLSSAIQQWPLNFGIFSQLCKNFFNTWFWIDHKLGELFWLEIYFGKDCAKFDFLNFVFRPKLKKGKVILLRFSVERSRDTVSEKINRNGLFVIVFI